MLPDYEFKGVSASWGGQLITGFGEGGLKIVMNKDAAELTMGIDGEGARAKLSDKSGTITVELLQTAKFNSIFSAGYKAGTKAPFIAKDTNGDTFATCMNAWVKTPAELEFKAGIGVRVWVLESDDLDYEAGGNNE